MILNLFSPDGHSVNDGIRKDPFMVQYMKVDDTIDGIMSLGRALCLRSLMWKVLTTLFPYTLMIFIFLACSGKEITLCMLWFNFILGLIFICHCFKLIIMHYHTPKQREIKFKPRIKLNHNMYITLPFGLPSAPYIFFFSCGPGGLGSQKTV